MSENQFIQITADEFQSKVKVRLEEVFAFPLKFTQPFTQKMERRFIFYHDNPTISPELLNALYYSTMKLGDTGFYFSFVDYDNEYVDYPGFTSKIQYLKTYYFGFENIDKYLSQCFITNHVLFSPSGTWGVFIGSDEFMVIGGIQSVMDDFVKQGVDCEESTIQFLLDWKRKKEYLFANTNWMPKLLIYAYGKSKADELIRDYL